MPNTSTSTSKRYINTFKYKCIWPHIWMLGLARWAMSRPFLSSPTHIPVPQEVRQTTAATVSWLRVTAPKRHLGATRRMLGCGGNCATSRCVTNFGQLPHLRQLPHLTVMRSLSLCLFYDLHVSVCHACQLPFALFFFSFSRSKRFTNTADGIAHDCWFLFRENAFL